MKVLIDITKKIEEYIKDYIPIGAGDNVFCYPDEIVRMIQNGTPIPDNATNEDIINTMFDRDMAYNIRCYVKNYMLMGEWLDTPYQKGGKDEAN